MNEKVVLDVVTKVMRGGGANLDISHKGTTFTIDLTPEISFEIVKLIMSGGAQKLSIPATLTKK